MARILTFGLALAIIGFGGSCTESEPRPLKQSSREKMSFGTSTDQVDDTNQNDEEDEEGEDMGEGHTDDHLETPKAVEPPRPQSAEPSPGTSATPPTRPGTGTAIDPPSNLVEFRIKEGTARGPWNTRETMVTVKVGQTLRIVNDDSTDHRLHTNGAPCPHQPGTLKKGEEFLCKIENTLEVDPARPSTYDHNVGPAAAFFIRAVK